jgi:hypothetical protein
MNYSIIKIIVYMISVFPVMYGLNCVRFDKFVKIKNLTQFYTLYMVIIIVLTYLFGQFILELMEIRIW